jgi:hypothetical protein
VSAGVSAESRRLHGEGILSWSGSGGVQLKARLTAAPVDALRIELEAGTRGLNASCTIRDPLGGREITVTAGTEAGALSFALCWKTTAGGPGGSGRGP